MYKEVLHFRKKSSRFLLEIFHKMVSLFLFYTVFSFINLGERNLKILDNITFFNQKGGLGHISIDAIEDGHHGNSEGSDIFDSHFYHGINAMLNPKIYR